MLRLNRSETVMYTNGNEQADGNEQALYTDGNEQAAHCAYKRRPEA